MFRRVLGKGYDQRRLKYLLVFLFVALAVPTGAVLWQAYGQLKWEAFHQFRSQAEELTSRIDAAISSQVAETEARNFAEYSFLNVTGDPGVGFLQRSPLSAFPVVQDLPGVIGYFQIDDEGQLSTPLLPAPGVESSGLGIGSDEYRQRQAVADRISEILANNRMVEGRDALGSAGQEAFDEVAQNLSFADRDDGAPTTESKDTSPEEERVNQYAKISDLRLDDALQKKSEGLEESANEADAYRQPATENAAVMAKRSRRVEQAALPEAMAPAGARAAEPEAQRALRVTTFESEVDPFEFSLLDSGEFVLFRKVWKDGTRFVQGVLIDRDTFLDQAVVSSFGATAISGMANLVIGFRDDVLRIVPAQGENAYPGSSSGLEGNLLYRGRLSSPFDAIELIFTVSRLPAGPGATVLGWTALLLAAVFVGGFLALYRLGLGQIRLARQQQDFVSSVSHELKTPLTSIRMYSEMLKEGWADEAKRKQYYEFIHDESERLSRLIANVLQLASITRNEPSFELAPVSVGELLDRVRSKIASHVEHSGFELAIKVDAGTGKAVIEVDEDCVMQIVINLVDNAVKFSQSAEIRRIEIGAMRKGKDAVRLSVRDHGPGIPREQMRKIFRLFYRPESELTRETVGTGIGLAIVHQLTLAMGGQVDVLNREPGAEFGITFPLART